MGNLFSLIKGVLFIAILLVGFYVLYYFTGIYVALFISVGLLYFVTKDYLIKSINISKINHLSNLMSSKGYTNHISKNFLDNEKELFIYLKNNFLKAQIKLEGVENKIDLVLPSVYKKDNENEYVIVIEFNPRFLNNKEAQEIVISSFFNDKVDKFSVEELEEKTGDELENRAEEYNISIKEVNYELNSPYPLTITYSIDSFDNEENTVENIEKTENPSSENPPSIVNSGSSLDPSIFKKLPKLLSISNNKNKFSKLLRVEERDDQTVLIFSTVAGIINRSLWLSKKEIIADTLNHNVEIDFNDDAREIEIYIVKKLPKKIELDVINERLKKGKIYYGETTRKPIYVNIKDTKHQIIVGASGAGKSVFTNGLILSIMYNLESIDKIFMVDLKGGVELSDYSEVSNKITVIDQKEKLLEVIKRLELEMFARLKWMKDNKSKNIEVLPIFIIIDEFAQIMNMGNDSKSRKMQSAIIEGLTKISQLARATNLKLWVSLQKATSDNLDSSIKGNLQNRIVMKVKESYSKGIIGEETWKEIGVDPENFNIGRFAFEDDSNGEAHLAQFPYVSETAYKELDIRQDTVNQELSEAFNSYKAAVIREKMVESENEFTDMDLLAEVEGKTVEELNEELNIVDENNMEFSGGSNSNNLRDKSDVRKKYNKDSRSIFNEYENIKGNKKVGFQNMEDEDIEESRKRKAKLESMSKDDGRPLSSFINDIVNNAKEEEEIIAVSKDDPNIVYDTDIETIVEDKKE